MSRPIRVRERGRTFVATGPHVADVCRAAGLKPIYNGLARGYVMDAARLPDLLAHAAHHHIPVRLTSETTEGPA